MSGNNKRNMAGNVSFGTNLGERLARASKVAKWDLNSDGYLYTEASGLDLIRFRKALSPDITAEQYKNFYSLPMSVRNLEELQALLDTEPA